MRGYSAGEDNIILEAALIAGVHKSRGRHGGFHKNVKKFMKTHQTLCESRGLAVARSSGSLKMRMYRLYSSGVMKWGSHAEKQKVFYKQRSMLRNVGTFEQKKTRDYLIDLMFSDRGYTIRDVPAVETKEKEDVSHQARQAVAAARNARLARRAAAKENESRMEPWSENARPAAKGNESRIAPWSENVRAAAKEVEGRIEPWSTIARPADEEIESSTEPCSAIAHPHESSNFATVTRQMDKPGEVVPCSNVDGGKGKISSYQIYKENLKTVRELAAMQQEALHFMRKEYESHCDFLKKNLAELMEQQKDIIWMMETESERN